MNKYFVRDTPLAELGRRMMAVPNFAPRGSAHAVLCHYQPQAADVDSRNCLQYRRGCQSMTCIYLTERLQAGAVTMEELIVETIRPWKHPKLKQRAIDIAHRVEGFHFAGQLHIARMLRMAAHEDEKIDSRWLAAIYLLSAHGPLWQQTLAAVTPGQIDFSIVKLNDINVQDYIIYRVAKGIYSGTLGAGSEELAGRELVGDDTLLLILCAVLIARYGPEVMKVGSPKNVKCSLSSRQKREKSEQEISERSFPVLLVFHPIRN